MAMANHGRRKDSAADAAELAEIDKRAQELDEARARIADERRDLSHRRRRITDRMRKRGYRLQDANGAPA